MPEESYMETLIPIIISAAALVFSFYTFTNSRRQDRRSVMLKMRELLVSEDLQRGRYLLFNKVIDEASVRQLDGQEYRDINRALATYNLLGLYVERGYVDEEDIMDVWARSIYRSWVVGQPFLRHREQGGGYKIAAAEYFDRLAEKARKELIQRGENLEVTVWRSSPDSDSG
jgi:hypothetical protein